MRTPPANLEHPCWSRAQCPLTTPRRLSAPDPLRASMSPAYIKHADRGHTLCCSHGHRLRGGPLGTRLGADEAFTLGRFQRQESLTFTTNPHAWPNRVQRCGRVRLHIPCARDRLLGCAPYPKPCNPTLPGLGSGRFRNLGGIGQEVLRAATGIVLMSATPPIADV